MPISKIREKKQRSFIPIKWDIYTSFNASTMVPITQYPVLPSDVIKHNIKNMELRLTFPLTHPIMSDMIIDIDAFFVDNRAIMPNWERFMGDNTHTNFLPQSVHLSRVRTPKMISTGSLSIQRGMWGAYTGFPMGYQFPSGTPTNDTSLLASRRLFPNPFRQVGSALIWDRYYRDQDTQAPIVPTVGGRFSFQPNAQSGNQPANDNAEGYVLVDISDSTSSTGWTSWSPALPLPRTNKKLDLFTGMKISTNKGIYSLVTNPSSYMIAPNIMTSRGAFLNKGTLATRVGGDVGLFNQTMGDQNAPQDANSGVFEDNGSFGTSYASNFFSNLSRDGVSQMTGDIGSPNQNMRQSNFVELLRQAFQYDLHTKADLYYGTNYNQQRLAHFGIDVKDEFTMPRHLGRVSRVLDYTQVPQTTTEGANGIAELGAYSLTISRAKLFEAGFDSHGVIHVVATVRSRKIYQENLDRDIFADDRFDYPYPGFCHSSPQPIFRGELRANVFPDTLTPVREREVAGFRDIYDPMYRFIPSQIKGQMSTRQPAGFDTYSNWHLGSVLGANTIISSAFLQDDTQYNLDRCLQVPSGSDDQFIAKFENQVYALRPISVDGTAGLVDHRM